MKYIVLLMVVLTQFSAAQAQEGVTYKCDKPIAEFTLGMRSSPTKAQITGLCDCMWEKLDPDTRELSLSMSIGQMPNHARIQEYGDAIGKALDICGAFSL
jgi:hypothetical protein